MSKVRVAILWTRPAQHSLLSILRYIRQDNPAAARQFGILIRRKVSRLAQFPRSGRIVPEFSIPSLREIVAGNYRIIYRIVPSRMRVEILAVHHAARRLSEEDEP